MQAERSKGEANGKLSFRFCGEQDEDEDEESEIPRG
jgi:hypothetical protein